MTNPTASLAAVELAWSLTDTHTPTPEERAILSAFTGWGALAKAFDPAPAGNWVTVADRLEEGVPAHALRAARDQVDTSFFTPATVTAAVWDLLTAAGFTGGRILEPGCGSGAFMSTTPAGIAAEFTGVEIDPTSARIARLLNPAAEIIEGPLESTPLRDGHFDAAIGNVPFSDVRVHDKEGRGDRLHNYFTHRAVDAVRPGGYVILVTSRGAIDSKTGILSTIRDWDGAAFIGAVRLPSGAFAEAGTAAVTDIIVIRKNDATCWRRPYQGAPDFETINDGYGYYSRREVDHRLIVTGPDGAAGATVPVSRYWADNPAHIAGRMHATGFDRAPLQVISDDPTADITAAVTALAATLPALAARDASAATLDDVVLADADGRKEGSFHLIDGALHRVESGKLAPARASKELSALVALRDLAADLLALESDTDRTDHEITATRQATRAAYEAYVTQFGELNRGTLVEGRVDEETGLPALSWRRPTMGGFRRDPDAALVMALEVFDQDTGEATPAPILLGRVNGAPRRAETADTAAEALAISVGESGTVDIDRIAGLLSLTPAEAIVELGDAVFHIGGQYVPAAEALSGNVRRKLRDARRRAEKGDQDAARYAAALEKVIPADLGPTDINVTLGSPFVTTDDVTAFLREVLGTRWGSAIHTPALAIWEVTDGGQDYAAGMEWGVPEMGPAKLVECALNNKLPEVTVREWRNGDWRQVRDPQKSAAANAKLELIRDRFSTWVWEDEDRAARICTAYNESLNSHVTRVYDGSGLTFPGLSTDFEPWPHQRAAVERIVSSERAMLAHPVGAGKTAELVMGARTLRQFGLANKPMIVVPNHLLDQIAREAQQLFPTGRFLIASKDDLARDSRRLFAARCATGDWDAVIITHSSFGMIPVRPEVEAEWISEQKHNLRWAMTMESSDRGRGAKAIARAVRALDAKLQKLRDGAGDPDAIFFDQLGVDYIAVDEAHLFRRLDTGSQSRDNSGMGSGSSKRATDLLMKIETLAERRPGMPVASFFTGTPWSNTLAETWVWQRFLQPETLESAGLLQFDAWVSAFVRYESNIEVAPDGSGFRMYRRPVGVVNAPELKTIFGQIADVMDPEQLGLTRPEHTVRNVTVEATPEQREFVRDLADRADAIRNGEARERGDAGKPDNMLVICNDGRKVALDPILAGLSEQSVKLTKAADAIAEEYHAGAGRRFGEHPTPGVFQLAFMDLGTPHPGDSQSYGRLRRQLVDRGIPAQMIRFVHEATTDKARAALFAACRDGQVAVLVASTAKAGMGTNIQTRLTHLIHVDAPWLPSEVIQREGRAVRPGNQSGHVTITRLVTEGTFDAYMWQALERKSRAFDALYASGATAREIEDVSGATLSYGEVKALASGNPLLLDQAKLRAQVKQLQVMRAMHLQGVNTAHRKAKHLRDSAAGATHRAGKLRDAAAVITAPADREKSLEELTAAIRTAWQSTQAARYGTPPRGSVRYRGITVELTRDLAENIRTVGLAMGWRTFDDFLVAPKDARRAADFVAALVLDRVDSHLDRLAEDADRADASAVAYAAQAAQMDAAAAGARFDQQGALEAAVVRLAEIDAAIAEDAAQPIAA